MTAPDSPTLLAVICGVYGLFFLTALTNALLMRRPGKGQPGWHPAVCIPARNEAENLKRLVPELIRQGAKVYVADDESDDGTAEAASSAGAFVLKITDPLPPGWTGKNRALHELTKITAEDYDGEWLIFLDADTYPAPNFIAAMHDLTIQAKTPVITGIPKLLPGKGLEPVHLAWVAWIILATNQFGLVERTKKGHANFLNGQIQLWKASTYFEVNPHEAVKGEIMEDVKIGRLLARRRIPVTVANLGGVLSVKMYDTLGESLDGMSKNAFFITGTVWGSVLLSLLMLILGWGWLLAGAHWYWPYLILMLSKWEVDHASRQPLWTIPLMPLTLTLAAYTIARSAVWKQQGRIKWKGRTYS